MSNQSGRDMGGRIVREAWVRWALTQPKPKPSWLVPYDELSEPDKEADRQIFEACRGSVMAQLDAGPATPKVRDIDATLKLCADQIAASCCPDDPKLQVAFAIARYLKLDWPSAYRFHGEVNEAMVERACIACWGKNYVPSGLMRKAMRRALTAALNPEAVA